MTLPSDLKAINELLDGGYEEHIPTAIFGLPETGKSIFLNQEACFISKTLNSGALLIDTEGGNYVMLLKWIKTFQQRFNATYDIVKCKVKDDRIEYSKSPEGLPLFVINLRDIKSFMQFFGTEVDINISEKGKFSIRYIKSAKNFCQEMISQYDISTLVVDSLSCPLSIFSGGEVNYPARADALKMWFSSIQSISEDNDILVFISHHATMNPENPYSEPTMYGGKWVKHNTKISLYFEESKSTKKEFQGIRRVYLTRYFDKPRFVLMKKVKLTNNGFEDVEEHESNE